MTSNTPQDRSERRRPAPRALKNASGTTNIGEHYVAENTTEDRNKPAPAHLETANASGKSQPSQALRARGVEIDDAIITPERREVLHFSTGKRSRWIDRGAFALDGRTGFNALKDAGIYLFSNAEQRELIERVAELTEFREQVVIERPGWTAGQYAFQDGDISTPPSVAPSPLMFSPVRERVRSRGRCAAWRNRVADFFSGHPIGEFILCAAFAPFLLEPLRISGNLGIDLNGVTGSAKSHLQFAAASVWGPASDSEGHFRHTLAGTVAGTDQLIPYHNDSLFVLEEMGLIEGSRTVAAQKLFELVMRLSHGDQKRRFNDDIGNGITTRCIFLTSSNESLQRMLSGLPASQVDAAMARLTTIHVPERMSGVFETLPTGVTLAGHCATLRERLAQNYGSAARRFAQKVVEHRARDEENLISGLRRRADACRTRLTSSLSGGVPERAVESIALVATAGELAKHYRLLPRAFDPETSAVACSELVQASRRRPISMVDRIGEWLRNNPFYDLRDGELPSVSDSEMTERGAFVSQGVRGRTEVLLSEKVFRTIFPDRSHILQTREADDVMIKEDRKSYQTKRTVRRGRGQERLYCFKVSSDLI